LERSFPRYEYKTDWDSIPGAEDIDRATHPMHGMPDRPSRSAACPGAKRCLQNTGHDLLTQGQIITERNESITLNGPDIGEVVVPPKPNHLVRAARERTPSQVAPGECMSRQELTEAVTAWLWQTTNTRYDLDARLLAKWERGDVRWPSAHTAPPCAPYSA
jgi:hypothetical protein